MDFRKTTDQLLKDNLYTDLVRSCRAALSNNPHDTDLLYKLAFGLEHTHNLGEARSVADDILRLDPGHLHASLLLAKIDKREGNIESARERLDKLQHRKSTPQYKCEVLKELGETYDRTGDYTMAFYYFHYSNLEISNTIDANSIDPDAIFTWISNYKNTFTSQFMNNWHREEPNDGIPSPIFLVGFPRSGTTLTEQIITACGNVMPTNEQPLIHEMIKASPRVLGRALEYPGGLDELQASEITLLRNYYWELAEKMMQAERGSKEKYLLDKLPLNLIELGTIHRIFPNARVVAVIRDPRDCCLSCFMNYFVPNDAMIHFFSIEQSANLYSSVMDYWLHIRSFIQQPVFELRYEDLVANPHSTARALVDFLGLEWEDSILDFYENAGSRDVRTPSYADISRPLYDSSIGRWKNYASFMGKARDTLSSYIDEFGYEK